MNKIYFTFIFVCMLIAGCSNNNNANISDLKTDYEVSLGETFSFEIRSNATTGYSWAWVNKNDVSVVELAANEYIPDKPIIPGSGGKEVWTFKGIKKGIDTIKINYLRPWEPDKPAEQKSFTVKVK